MNKKYEYEELTKSIIGVFFKMANDDQTKGLPRKALKNALAISLRKRRHRVQTDISTIHRYDNKRLADGVLDLLVDNTIPISVKKLNSIHDRHKEELVPFMKNGQHIVGLVLNFSPNRAEVRRVYRPQFAPKK